MRPSPAAPENAIAQNKDLLSVFDTERRRQALHGFREAIDRVPAQGTPMTKVAFQDKGAACESSS